MVHYTLFAVAKLVFFFDRIKKKVEKKDGDRKKILSLPWEYFRWAWFKVGLLFVRQSTIRRCQ